MLPTTILTIVSFLLSTNLAAVVGPVLSSPFPDPSIIKLDNNYYAFSSRTGHNTTLINTPIASSQHFQSGWSLLPHHTDALPDPGPWTTSPNAHVLTPDIDRLACGSFILYYIAVPTDSNRKEHCIGCAFSPNITGPFTPQSTPLLCPSAMAGTAGPNGFTHAGERYLVFKNASGHDAQHESYIAIEQVGADGFTPLSPLTDLLNSTHADDNDVEGPALVQNPSNGGFVLFFTVGTFNATDLRIEYATSEAVRGPYVRRGVLIKTGVYDGTRIEAPVGLDVVNANVSEVVFEAFGKDREGRRERLMYTATLRYEGTDVRLA